MGLIQRAYTRAVLRPLAEYLKAEATANLEKDARPRGGVVREVVQRGSTKGKPGGVVSFATLRLFSVQYDVARAAINRRKRQLNQLEWNIVAADPEDQTDYTKLSKELSIRFKQLGGYRVRFREFIDVQVEDLLVLDAVALEKIGTRNGELYSLNTVDAATIRLMVDDTGKTPMPPAVAYEQYIRGTKTAEWTAEEMYYEMMNPRTNTPYGLSPLESFIVQVSTALKSEAYNMGQLTEGNIPEGLFSVPESWTADQINEYQTLWDAAIAGNTNAVSRLKFVPPGSYVPTKKPEDMRYKDLQEWLMKKCCMLFEIQPQELGFTDTVNKSTGEVQQDIGFKTGLKPLAHFFEDIFTDVIQLDWGYPQLRFKYQGLDDVNEKEEAEVSEIYIRSGIRTVDEVRSEKGWEKKGIDKPFVLGTPTFIDEDSVELRNQAAQSLIEMSKEPPAPAPEPEPEPEPQEEKSADQRHLDLVTELRAFRKYAMTRKKAGKSLRPFRSDVLMPEVTQEINERVAAAPDAEAVRDIFSEFFKDYQINFLADVIQLKGSLDKVRRP